MPGHAAPTPNGDSLNDATIIGKAMDAFEQRRPQEALKALASVLRTSPSPQAHLLTGVILEFGGPDVPVDLERAISHYRCASHLVRNRDPLTLLFLARVHLKSGPSRYAQALRYIREASAVRRIPEVELAFAKYYEVAEPNVDLAKRYLVRGALRGSIAGAFALARVLRQTGCAGQARVVDVLRMLATPFVLLVIGRRSFRAFDGY